MFGKTKTPAAEIDVNVLVAEQDAGGRQPGPLVARLLLFTTLAWSLFQLWIASPLPFALGIGVFNDTQSRAIHLAFAIFLAFLAYPAFKRSPRSHVPVQDWVFALVGAFCASYIFFFYRELSTRPGQPTTMDLTVAVAGIVMLLEATRRALGLPMVIVAIVFLAAVLQSLTGFGFALIVMPLVTLVIDLQTAAPLIALAGLTAYTVNLVRFRRAVNLQEVARLAVASAAGIPIGIWALVRVDELDINRAMGVILISYAAYALLRPATSRLPARWWAYPAGFLAGCLGGAYNTPGPPVVVYGSLQQWPKDEYRAILQTLFFVNGILIVGSHALARHMLPQVWALYAWVVPALLLGLWAGARLDHRLDQELFRKLVTAMILLLGLSLLLGLGRR